ncbi:DUF1631 domain-containing protein [Pseudomonas sp. S36]|uniref:DUF1631 domain-containing protein n=1 Tax=Pseudomonas sp. S36 TaxID=2767447 RepID=UPI001912AA92|nr:DUF1631 domain-containing protein [Pseudomonas sp. S36]MBK4990696.1 DUF1631 domain-containing protein [Pseudomonas sp. S36]
MRKEGKVVPLAAASDQGRRPPLAGLPVLLLQVRDKAALQLRQGLHDLFDNADDTLFEMADKAADRGGQHLYFEAMRDLRLKRKSIERGVIDTFHDRFACLGDNDLVGGLMVPAPVRRAVHPQLTATIDAMVARVNARDATALQHMGLRFQALLEWPLPEQLNPLAPAALCGYFTDAVRSLGVAARVKDVLLKLFERYVLRDADVIYDEANRLMAAAGVLSHLPSSPRRRAEDRQLSVRQPLDEGEGVIAADASSHLLFDTLQPLLARSRGLFAPRLQANGNAQPVDTADVLRLLSHLQHYVPGPEAIDEFELGQQLEQLLLRVSVRSGTRRRIHPADEDMINLMGRVFTFIGCDENLPPVLRSLLKRLQIPLLKVALLDKSVLSRPGHPARRLLNEIAAASLGCNHDKNGLGGTLQLRVERIVQRVLNDFAEDPRLFAELLEEFLGQNQHERRRNELFEQRTRDAEEGRVQALQARRQVQAVLNQRLRGRVLPQGVVHMLVQHWSQVLMLAWLKQGGASWAWRTAVHTMDTLLASVTPPYEPEALVQQVPALLKALREGLASVATDSATTRDFFLQLEQLHLRACTGEQLPTEDDVLVAQDIILDAAQEEGAVMPRLADGPLSQVNGLRIGTWIEVLDEQEAQRCKLVARIDGRDRLVFANHAGMKVREWDVAGLGLALQQGTVRVLDDGPLFDRALDAVIKSLHDLN